MQFFSEWMTNIILFVLLATIVELLLPRGTLQKYVKMVLGLLLIFIIIQPIMKIFAMDPQEFLDTFAQVHFTDEELEKSLEKQKLEIQERQQAYILKEMADRLTEQTEKELMEKFQLKISSIQFDTVDDGFRIPGDGEQFLEQINTIHVTVTSVEHGMVEPVEEVMVTIGKPRRQERTAHFVRTFLAERWGVDEEMIEIFVDGRDP